ncbi:MAG: nicotinate phosphoribosyltransferase, partial [Acidimicrobiia bacterium]|nr:nicotinate phosphoribosyltransferase [Acidimicrobiia bacterium]
LFARSLPPGRGFLVSAGLDDALELLDGFAFEPADLDWLAEHGFDDDCLRALRDLRFTGDVWAVPEGRLVLPDEPLLEITAPLPEAQLVETIVLNQLTYQTALATKAARCALATDGRAQLVDFSLRRTHGIEAGMTAARVGAIAGFTGTSNVEAARRYGLTPVGTMAHSYIESFPTEREAFAAFAADYPDHTTLLVDTYDTLEGIAVALDVVDAAGLGDRFGIRLDSGDLLALSIEARRMLDAAGHGGAVIVASGGLDEHQVQQLLDAGAPIDVFGVGTRIGVSADAPTLDTAYKLVEYDGRPAMKLSEGKVSRPGPKQVHRRGVISDDVLATRAEPPPPGSEALLEPVMVDGATEAEGRGIGAAQERLSADLAALPAELRQLDAQAPNPVRASHRLAALTREVVSALSG